MRDGMPHAHVSQACDSMRRVPTREAAEILGIERSTLSRWVTVGKITPIERVGSWGRDGIGQMFFDADELEHHPLRRRPEARRSA